MNSFKYLTINDINSTFPPNKPSLYAPSVKGTKLYIIGLINFILTHRQDNKIWLEKKAGFKRDYRVTVIIDSSKSCFNEIMFSHSLKTTFTLLKMLSILEIPYFDLIIGTKSKPKIVCCGLDTINCLSNIFGIGLGLYPKGISDIFSKCIWSLNPDFIGKALSVFYGNEIQYSNEIFSTKVNLTINKYDIYKELLENANEFIKYQYLKKFLEETPLFNESFEEIINKDEANEETTNNLLLTNQNTMYAPNFFKGLKCLLCAFWSKNIAGEKEKEWVDYKYFTERYGDKKQKCLKEVFDYYGVELVVKTDYKSCIKELEKGLYYACWIICGDGSGRLPEGGNSNLVGQFIECLIKYWIGGGALVWWCDNEPLVYEANLFLEKVEFPGEILNTSVKFGGNDKGKKIMKQGNIKDLKIKILFLIIKENSF